MRSNRPYVQIAPDVLERARQIDLLSYLREFEPSNLVKVKGTGNVYCTAEHDSLKISNGKWYWWSRGVGGYSALDYLIKVREYGFVEAVEILTGQAFADWKPPPAAEKKDEPKVLLLPPKNRNCDRVVQYLSGVELTISSYRIVLPRALSLKVPTTTMLFLWVKMKAERLSMPPAVARWGALSVTHRAATSGIRSDFWRGSRALPCICLKPPLIYYPMPLISNVRERIIRRKTCSLCRAYISQRKR